MKIVVLRGGPGRGVTALGDGAGQWVLVNVSASAAHRLEHAQPADSLAGLHEARVRAVVLTDAQIDQVGGLIGLRGGKAIDLYATPAVFEELTVALPVLPALQHYCAVHWRVVPVAGDRRVAPFEVEGLPGLEFTAIAIDAPAPPHSARAGLPLVGDTIALAVRDRSTGQRVFCAPGPARASVALSEWMRQADCLLMEAGAGASVEQLAAMPARHKVLFGGADTRERLAARGIALAFDGLQIEL